MVDAKTEGWIEIAQRGFENWKAKPHNARWFRKIDGTPIPNDLTICIGEAFAEPLRSLSLRVEAEKRAREEAALEHREEELRDDARLGAALARAEAAETHSAALAGALEEARDELLECKADYHRNPSSVIDKCNAVLAEARSLLAPKEDTANG